MIEKNKNLVVSTVIMLLLLILESHKMIPKIKRDFNCISQNGDTSKPSIFDLTEIEKLKFFSYVEDDVLEFLDTYFAMKKYFTKLYF